MMNYWNNLNRREQAMVAFTLSAVILYLVYSLLFSSLLTSVHTRTQSLKEKKQTLQWMKTVNKPNESRSETISEGQLITLIATQLHSNNLRSFPNQLQQTSQGDIQLNFEAVPYSYFIKWLWELQQRYTVSIKQLTMESSKKEGMVKLLVVIKV